MSTPITTGFDAYVSRYPFLANLTYKGAEDDPSYKSLVDMRGKDYSPIPNGVETHSVDMFGPMQRRAETTPYAYDTPTAGETKKTYYIDFGLRLYFTRNLIEDAQYGLIEKSVSHLGVADSLTRNLEVATLYDDAFTGSIYTGPDNLALLSASHTSNANNALLRSNILDTPAQFGYTSAQALITKMRGQKTARGHSRPAIKNNQTIKVLLPNNGAEFEADRLFNAGAALEPGTNHNSINVLKKFRWEPIVNTHLQNMANWFFINSEETGIRMVEKRTLNTDTWADNGLKGMNYDVDARWCLHCEMWENTYGSNG